MSNNSLSIRAHLRMNYCVSNHSAQSPNGSFAVIDTDADDDDVCGFIIGTCEFHYIRS